MTITRQITRAMATQLDRVNSMSSAGKAERENHILKQRLIRAEQEIRLLQEQLELARESALPSASRPVATMTEIARREGMHHSTVWRYINEGLWDGYQNRDGRWFIYLDQPFPRRPNRRNSRK